jgi:uncharacterized protein (DUF1330 family)
MGVEGKDPMAVYLISDVGPVAPEYEAAWKAYLDRAPATIAKYGGRYLARGGAIHVIEGSWSPQGIVLVEFSDSAALARWYSSPEYAEALMIRGTTLQRNMICVEGSNDGGPEGLLGSTFVRSES